MRSFVLSALLLLQYAFGCPIRQVNRYSRRLSDVEEFHDVFLTSEGFFFDKILNQKVECYERLGGGKLADLPVEVTLSPSDSELAIDMTVLGDVPADRCVIFVSVRWCGSEEAPGVMV